MKKEVLVIGYGSIGKRHVRNLLELGITPYVLTKYPDKAKARFISGLAAIKDRSMKYCIIASPTARHLSDFKDCISFFKGKIKNIIIEKPLEASFAKAKKIKDISVKYELNTFVAYNLRFINRFDIIKEFIRKNKNTIKIVEVVAGQDLREWRPGKDIKDSYSAYRDLGGGVDLDLSHEIDYVLWLFGKEFGNKMMHRSNISALKIKSPDIFKLILDYKKFIVDITLDYIRKPKERYLKILCDNGNNFYYDFVRDTFVIPAKAGIQKEKDSRFRGNDTSILSF
jgi:predicted dehydrogenase